MNWLKRFFLPKKVSFKVRSVSGTELFIQIDGTPKAVTQFDLSEMVVFRTKEFLSPQMTEDFLKKLGALTTKKVILLPAFIEVVTFERK